MLLSVMPILLLPDWQDNRQVEVLKQYKFNMLESKPP